MADYPHPYQYPHDGTADCGAEGCGELPGATVHDPSRYEDRPKMMAAPRRRRYHGVRFTGYDLQRLLILLILAGLLVAEGIGDSWLAVHA